MAECRFDNTGNEVESDDEESDDEDDDDDDEDGDDGANMMLSNASLRRPNFSTPPSVAFARSDSGSNPNPNLSERRRQNHAIRQTSTTTTSTPSSFGRKTALSVSRGGAAAVGGTEFGKRLFVAALVTLLYEGAVGHLLEFVKIVMQTSPPGTTYGQVLRQITSEKGIAGVWDGFVPWGIFQAVMKGGVFGLAHAVALSYLKPLGEDGVLPMQLALTLAGGIAGGFQGYVLSPTLLLKTRVMTDPVFRESMSLLRTTVLSLKIGLDVIAKEGALALMKGSNVFATKRVFDWATRYYFSDLFQGILLGYVKTDALTPPEKIAADLLGGTASTIVTLPLDVMVAKTQDAKKAGVKVSAVSLFKDELKEGGWRGLKDSYLQGFEARLLHVCFTTVAMKTGTVLMYDLLFNKN
eukprot:CAMPEP_0195519660 /NCGR_PEP_ID=MMETSP0794_2-20130614/15216_1 /TAXON_ID=515487 /ORGANISM="Stephanopyxis turris, Strain CCMP 815" /LENGTH=408 /DNA_ID=CAMNT_0040648851 /DNA_START=322 /DNA_END=1548 /DNA_ORIENTATION=-